MTLAQEFSGAFGKKFSEQLFLRKHLREIESTRQKLTCLKSTIKTLEKGLNKPDLTEITTVFLLVYPLNSPSYCFLHPAEKYLRKVINKSNRTTPIDLL